MENEIVCRSSKRGDKSCAELSKVLQKYPLKGGAEEFRRKIKQIKDK